MFKTETVFVLIVIFCVMVFVVALFKIFKKKGKSEKKEKKPKTDDPQQADSVDSGKMQKKEPRINKKKLKQIENGSSKIEPAFSKEELEKEREEALKKEEEKVKQQQQRTPSFNGGAPFRFPVMPQNQNNMVQNHQPEPKITFSATRQQKAEEIPIEVKKEDKDFVEILKQKGIVKKEQSFGESLIIKEAIDTPAAKETMKKKRQKWM